VRVILVDARKGRSDRADAPPLLHVSLLELPDVVYAVNKRILVEFGEQRFDEMSGAAELTSTARMLTIAA